MYESWGEKLLTPTSYDPKKDFFNTGTNFINSVTLTTGTKSNQTFASVSSTNSKGIVPNNEYDRLNFTIRNTATFLNDKLQLDLGASYVKQKDYKTLFHCFCTFGIKLCKYSNYIKNEELRVKNFWKWGRE